MRLHWLSAFLFTKRHCERSVAIPNLQSGSADRGLPRFAHNDGRKKALAPRSDNLLSQPTRFNYNRPSTLSLSKIPLTS
jgi:hypothetical protein